MRRQPAGLVVRDEGTVPVHVSSQEARLPLALAVVGCGAVIEGLYRGALKQLESRRIAQVIALVDPDPVRIARLRRHFLRARAFSSPSEAFAHIRPDLTIIASPPARHAEQTLEAFMAGSDVLCEKPMATSVADAERMVAAAHAAERVLAAGMFRRLFPCLAAARALLAAGACGDEISFTYREGSVYNWPVSTDAPFRRATSGGGVLIDVGSHVLDFLSALFGAPTVVDYADDAQAGGVETNCQIDLAFPAARGSVQLSWSQPLLTELRIHGSAGELALDPARLDSVRWRRHGGRWQSVAGSVTWPRDLDPGGLRRTARSHYDCIYHQLVLALRAAVRREPVPTTGEEALTTVRTIDACYRLAKPLRLPWLTAAEQERARARHWTRRPWAA